MWFFLSIRKFIFQYPLVKALASVEELVGENRFIEHSMTWQREDKKG